MASYTRGTTARSTGAWLGNVPLCCRFRHDAGRMRGGATASIQEQEAGLPDAETTFPVETLIHDTIRTLLEQRGATGIEIRPESTLTGDLGLDSLELAELSAVLEDEVGHDPFSEGIVPETVAELIGYYNN